MSGKIKWIVPATVLTMILASCNNEKEDSKFSEILNQQPFSYLTDSIKNDPGRDDLYFRRAVLLNSNNLPEPALDDFRKAWTISKQENYALGISNILMEKNPDSAVLFLNTAVKELPTSIFLQIRLARAYEAKNKTDEALSVCDQILQIDSTQVNTLVLKSELLEKKKDTIGSIALLEKVNMLIPENMEMANRLAYLYAESRNPKTIGFCDKMISRDSLGLHAEPYYVKGVYYTNIGEMGKAIQLFNQTISRDHRFLNAYIEKGKIQLGQNKTSDALKTFQLVNTISPAFADSWYWIAQCQEKLGQKEDAKLNYEKAYSLDKTFSEAKEAAEKL